MTSFIGRREELEDLRSRLKKKIASFVVIRGRRRIGKSRLIQEFGKDLPCHILEGVTPKPDTTRQEQIDDFLSQIKLRFKTPPLSAGNWAEAFWILGQLCSQGRIILALDEISWIGSKDKHFLGQLKNAWDLYFSQNPQLILIVCGSVSSWIEKNILSHTGFVGRVSLDLQLTELPLRDAVKFWDSRRSRISNFELFKTLGVTGGVPRYLEEIEPQLSAEENIRRLCFTKKGLLYREFDQIFSELFVARAPLYVKILKHLVKGPSEPREIAKAIGKSSGGTLSEHLHALLQAGFISEDPTWDLPSARLSRLKKYRLSDNYTRFYLRYILPRKHKIAKGRVEIGSLSSLPGWETMMGLQFENLVLNNERALLKVLYIRPGDILQLGPYFQRKTAKLEGCQIDILIQASYRTLWICAVKFSQNQIGPEVIQQLKRKQAALKVPKNWSTRLVLIHVNGVTPEVEQSEDLDHIVDFGQLLED